MSNSNGFNIRVKVEYASLVPKLSDAEYQSLKASIHEHGLLYPLIVTPEGVILDGHHRYKACVELGIRIRYQIRNFKGDTVLEMQFIAETNCARRSLNLFQRIELAFRMEPVYAELAKRRRLSGLKNVGSSSSVNSCTNEDEKGRAIDKCAELAGVSATYYNMAKRIWQLPAPTEALQELREGKKSIREVYNKLRKQSSFGTRPQRRQSTGATKYEDSLPKIEKWDTEVFHKIASAIPDESVDLIVTFLPVDTPWDMDYSGLMRFANRVLKTDTGIFFIANRASLDTMETQAKEAGFGYKTLFASSSPDYWSPIHLHLPHIYTPIMVFAKGADCNPAHLKKFSDIMIPRITTEPEVVAKYIIENFSPENGVVCDPTMAYGDTTSAAIRMRRQFIGWKIEASTIEIVERRTASVSMSDLFAAA